MMIEDAFATLVGEPFNLRPWEIAELTIWQIRHLYFHARDDKGRVVPTQPPETIPQISPYQWFVNHWRLYGLRDDLIDILWKSRGKSN